MKTVTAGIICWNYITGIHDMFAKTFSGTDNKGFLIPYIFIIVFTGNVTQFWKINEF
jgi:hypothetical protein